MSKHNSFMLFTTTMTELSWTNYFTRIKRRRINIEGIRTICDVAQFPFLYLAVSLTHARVHLALLLLVDHGQVL